MVRKIDWDRHIGRRLKLRDLHIFLAVVERGSLSGAAAKFGVSQPAVSEVISRLEQMFGVRLFDRSTRGVRLTKSGEALRDHGTVVFHELRQTIRDIELLADPASGDVRVGCPETLLPVLSPVIGRFCRKYPRVAVDVHNLVTPPLDLPELRTLKLDFALARIVKPLANQDDDLDMEVLFHDRMVVVTGMHSRWARRKRVDLADLVDESWILTPPGSSVYDSVTEAFRARGLQMPKMRVTTYSVDLRRDFLEAGSGITVFPSSILRLSADRFPLKVLPIELPARPWPVAIVTLKRRSLSPVVQFFIEQLRAFAREIAPRVDD